jgi:hypothetical protein
LLTLDRVNLTRLAFPIYAISPTPIVISGSAATLAATAPVNSHVTAIAPAAANMATGIEAGPAGEGDDRRAVLVSIVAVEIG